MSRRRGRARGGNGGREQRAGNGGPEAGSRKHGATEEPQMSQYIFTFELIRQYPTVRSFLVKQPLKRSFSDTFSELLGGNKKGIYRL